jgi:intracellular septation protein
MNQLLEWSPLIVFFVIFKLYGIYWATGSLMVTTVALMSAHKLQTGRYKKMHIVTVAVVLILGTATLVLHDKRFIQWKPTILMGFAAIAFFVSTFVGARPLARRMMESVFSEPVDLSRRAWAVINLLWAGWFAVLAVTNIYIAQNFAENVWVNFKVFGITIAIVVFMIPQVIWLNGKTRPAPVEGD